MPIRKITLNILKAWLPPTFTSDTTWTDADLQAALDAGHHPRVIAAEVWSEYALSLPADADGGEKTVKSWTNLNVSVEYDSARSPRDHALHIARLHRLRAPVKAVALVRTIPEE